MLASLYIIYVSVHELMNVRWNPVRQPSRFSVQVCWRYRLRTVTGHLNNTFPIIRWLGLPCVRHPAIGDSLGDLLVELYSSLIGCLIIHSFRIFV